MRSSGLGGDRNSCVFVSSDDFIVSTSFLFVSTSSNKIRRLLITACSFWEKKGGSLWISKYHVLWAKLPHQKSSRCNSCCTSWIDTEVLWYRRARMKLFSHISPGSTAICLFSVFISLHPFCRAWQIKRCTEIDLVKSNQSQHLPATSKVLQETHVAVSSAINRNPLCQTKTPSIAKSVCSD